MRKNSYIYEEKRLEVYENKVITWWDFKKSPDIDDNVVLMSQKMKNFPVCETCTEVKLPKLLHLARDGAEDLSSRVCPLKSPAEISTFYSPNILSLFSPIYDFILEVYGSFFYHRGLHRSNPAPPSSSSLFRQT